MLRICSHEYHAVKWKRYFLTIYGRDGHGRTVTVVRRLNRRQDKMQRTFPPVVFAYDMLKQCQIFIGYHATESYRPTLATPR